MVTSRPWLRAMVQGALSAVLKGSGPAVVTVTTAVTRAGSDVVGNGEGITPRAGERWMVYTTSRAMPYQTSVCGGSALVDLDQHFAGPPDRGRP